MSKKTPPKKTAMPVKKLTLEDVESAGLKAGWFDADDFAFATKDDIECKTGKQTEDTCKDINQKHPKDPK